MKVGVLTNTLRDRSFNEALEVLAGIGYEMITVGVGGHENLDDDHGNAKRLLSDPQMFKDFEAAIKRNNLELSTLNCPGNPIHPQKKIAQQMDEDMRNCVLLAEKLGLDRISTFSGCPGDSENALYPNWVTYYWPHEFDHVREWQWNEVAIPYWKDLCAFAKKHGVTKIGMEIHPNQLVYNTDTLLRMREAVGEEIGLCLDVSHLFWRGMDPVVVIEAFAGCIWQFHAKDVITWEHRVKRDGVIDARIGRAPDRTHNFCIPGAGHDMQTWKAIARALRLAGYDRDMCFEHEDRMMGQMEGLERAYDFLKDVVQSVPIEECGMYWKAAVTAEKTKFINE